MSDIPERTPIAQAPLSIILLAYNAGPDLEEVVNAWDGYLASLSHAHEILLVNDGSSDDTGSRAELLAAQKANLRVCHHETPAGSGAALRTGLAASHHPLVLTVPCDRQYQPPDLYRLLESIDQVDLVTGYRVGLPLPTLVALLDTWRRMLARVVLGAPLEPRTSWPGLAGWRRRWAARWLFGVRVQDPECPYRLYRREVLQRIPIQCDTSAAHLEILAKANHLTCIMAEVPVSWMQPTSVAYPVEPSAGKELRRLFFAPEFCPPPPPLVTSSAGPVCHDME